MKGRTFEMVPAKIILLYLLVLISVLTDAQDYTAQNYNSNPEGQINAPDFADKITSNARFPRQSHKTEEHNGENHQGLIGPVHTFVKTDRNAHFKWGVRHYVDQRNNGHY